MRYRIFDVRAGLLGADADTEAGSPIEAVRKLYKNVRRVTARDEKRGLRGNIVVNNTYVYDGDRKEQESADSGKNPRHKSYSRHFLTKKRDGFRPLSSIFALICSYSSGLHEKENVLYFLPAPLPFFLPPPW